MIARPFAAGLFYPVITMTEPYAHAGSAKELLGASPTQAQRLAQSHQADTQARYDAHTQAAIDAGVFGAPTYVVEGEMFWGQDRLDFLQRKLGL